jgi:hypothetical protein
MAPAAQTLDVRLTRQLEERLLEASPGDLDVTSERVVRQQRPDGLIGVRAAQDHSVAVRSADATPGNAASLAGSTSASVARIVRLPTRALISVVGPSATIRP